jgi:hypothetical protein
VWNIHTDERWLKIRGKTEHLPSGSKNKDHNALPGFTGGEWCMLNEVSDFTCPPVIFLWLRAIGLLRVLQSIETMIYIHVFWLKPNPSGWGLVSFSCFSNTTTSYREQMKQLSPIDHHFVFYVRMFVMLFNFAAWYVWSNFNMKWLLSMLVSCSSWHWK